MPAWTRDWLAAGALEPATAAQASAQMSVRFMEFPFELFGRATSIERNLWNRNRMEMRRRRDGRLFMLGSGRHTFTAERGHANRGSQAAIVRVCSGPLSRRRSNAPADRAGRNSRKAGDQPLSPGPP